MAFLNIRLPVNISYGASGGPVFSTTTAIAKNKTEIRTVNYQTPYRKYNVSLASCNAEQIEKIISFFNVCKGRAYGFRFRDWSDYTVKNSLTNITESGVNSIKLYRLYSIDQYTMERRVTKPINGTLIVKKNNVITRSYVADYDNGVLSFQETLPIGTVISTSFEFDVPVRFDTDFLPITIIGNCKYAINDIRLTEINV